MGGVVSILVLHVLSQEYLIKSQFDINKILFVLSILSYPIIDIIRVSLIRLLNGKSPFVADKNHIHHIILKKLDKHLYTSIMILILSFVFTILIQLIF